MVPNRELTSLRLNPFKVWLVVVAVSTVSYGSYVLQRLLRPEQPRPRPLQLAPWAKLRQCKRLQLCSIGIPIRIMVDCIPPCSAATLRDAAWS